MVDLKAKLGRAWELSRSAPLRVKIVLALLIVYLLSPIDLIPDFIPVLGQLDDILIFGLAMGYVGKHIPEIAEMFRKK